MPSVTTISPMRRFLLAGIACALAALLFRAELASALVARGDDYAARGNASGALKYYGRAIWIDRDLAAGVDRYTFFSFQQKTSGALRSAVVVASAYLKRHPDDGAIRADRGLCFQILKQYSAASRDFTAAANQLHSAQYYTFAGWARYRIGNRLAARRLWNLALKVNPSYSPAVGALRKNRL